VNQGVLSQAPASERATAMRAVAAKIPPGSRVSLALADGRRLKAVLLAVDGDDTLIVQRRTRLPEPPLRVHASDVTSLELDVPHTSVGKMIAIGAGIGAGVTLAFLAMLAAALDD
jgi:hypothetical protein